MSIFTKRPFEANTPYAIGGPKIGDQVFTFFGTGYVFNAADADNVIGWVTITNPVELSNFRELMKDLGLSNVLYELESYIKDNIGKNKQNDMVKDRAILTYKNYAKFCKFILETLHDMLWFKCTAMDDATSRMSRISIERAFKLIKPVAIQFLKILDEEIESQYPSKVSLKSITNQQAIEKMELKQDADIGKITGKNSKKNKKKKNE